MSKGLLSIWNPEIHFTFYDILLGNLPYSITEIFPTLLQHGISECFQKTACRVRRRFAQAAAKITAAESVRGCRGPKFRRRTRKEKRAAAEASWGSAQGEVIGW